MKKLNLQYNEPDDTVQDEDDVDVTPNGPKV